MITCRPARKARRSSFATIAIRATTPDSLTFRATTSSDVSHLVARELQGGTSDGSLAQQPRTTLLRFRRPFSRASGVRF